MKSIARWLPSAMRCILRGFEPDNPETLRYLALAEAEITRIAAVLKNADQIEENKQVHVLIPLMGKALAA